LPVAQAADWDTCDYPPGKRCKSSIRTTRRGAALLAWRDPSLDQLTISLKGSLLKLSKSNVEPAAAPRLQVFLTPAGSPALADQISVISSKGTPPPPAQVLFAFWDSYTAYTPATALRRWDGAHTGPYGGRHGLGNLLRTAQAQGIPLALLDLKNPAALAALDYTSGRQTVDEMSPQSRSSPAGLFTRRRSIFKPACRPRRWQKSWPNRTAGRQFQLTNSPFIYSLEPACPARGAFSFSHPPAAREP
jgi:hypothetical protein